MQGAENQEERSEEPIGARVEKLHHEHIATGKSDEAEEKHNKSRYPIIVSEKIKAERHGVVDERELHAGDTGVLTS